MKYRIFAVIVFLVVLPRPMQAQQLDRALEAFRSARFEEAEAGLMEELAVDTLNQAKLIDALTVLSRTRFALGNRIGARAAIESLLDLEPPYAEMDPEIVAPPVMKIYYDARKQRTDSYSVEPMNPAFRTIAVADFTNNAIGPGGSDYESLGVGIGQAMSGRLGGLEDIKVVERLRLQWLLEELDLQRRPGVVDQASAVQAGKLLGVQFVLFGSFMINKDRMLINCRMVNVETGEILFGEQVTGKIDDYFDLIVDLTGQVGDTFDTALAENSHTGDRPGFEALLAYSEGLHLLDDAQYQQAYDAFRRAEALGHAAAGRRAEGLREVL